MGTRRKKAKLKRPRMTFEERERWTEMQFGKRPDDRPLEAIEQHIIELEQELESERDIARLVAMYEDTGKIVLYCWNAFGPKATSDD